jgi:hypothetical protein
MDALTFVIAALAVYRVSALIAIEDGPFDVMARLRGRIDPTQSNWIGRGLRCVVCVSFWISIPAVWLIGGWLWPLTWLGLAGAVSIVHRWLTR